jgi:two-component system NarL family response regulator
MNQIRVVLADDHRVMLQGLKAMLEKERDVAVVGEATDGRRVIDEVEAKNPDVVVMDIGMPELNGIEATRRIRAKRPKTRVVALSTFADKRYVLEMFEAGAVGYVLKASAGEELLRAIRAAASDQKYLGAEVATSVVDSYVGQKFSRESLLGVLGSREREIVQLIAEGGTSKTIAVKLGISPATVEAHRRNVMKKLDIHSVAELTRYAIRQGLTTA